MTSEQVKTALEEAIRDLLSHDSYLLESNVNERTISHRLATYIESQFSDWDVDCEYNRNHDDVKRLKLKHRQTTDDNLEAITVYPDIIVHRRATDENLLVIEIKKTTNPESESYDLQKLEAFKNQLHYDYAAFVRLTTGNSAVGVKEMRFI